MPKPVTRLITNQVPNALRVMAVSRMPKISSEGRGDTGSNGIGNNSRDLTKKRQQASAPGGNRILPDTFYGGKQLLF